MPNAQSSCDAPWVPPLKHSTNAEDEIAHGKWSLSELPTQSYLLISTCRSEFGEMDMTPNGHLRAEHREVDTLAFVVHAMSDAVLIVNSKTTKIVEANTPALSIFGLSKNEMLEIEKLSQLHTGLERSIGSSSRDIVIQYQKKSGQTIQLCASAKSVLWSGEQCAMFIIQDRTLHDRLESERKDKASAEASSHAKSQFLSRIAADMRTPLSSVSLCLQLLSRKYELLSQDQDAAELIDVAFTSCEMLLSLVNDVLDRSRLDASGELVLHRHQIRTERFVSSIERIILPLTNAKGIEFCLEVAEDAPDVFVSDEVRLRQVMLNVLRTACRFTDAQSIVRLCVEMEGSIGPSGPKVTFVIEDTGRGIPPEMLPKELTRWNHGENPVSERTEDLAHATGIGLLIAKDIVMLLGGDLVIDSVIGKGSAFSITIPVDEALGLVSDQAQGLAAAAKNISSTSQIKLRSNRDKTEGRRRTRDMDENDKDVKSVPVAKRRKSNAETQETSSANTHPADSEVAELPGYSTKKVLVVDDALVCRKLEKRIIENLLGCTCDTACDGEEAVNMVKTAEANGDPYSVVFMDINMPNVDGYEATRQIRQLEHEGVLKRVNIIALTASALTEDRLKAEDAGMDSLICKPATKNSLVLAVESIKVAPKSKEEKHLSSFD